MMMMMIIIVWRRQQDIPQLCLQYVYNTKDFMVLLRVEYYLN